MRFELHGYDLDNLIKKLYLKKVTLYNLIKHTNEHLSFEIDDKDEKKVKRYIANFKVNRSLSKIKRIPKVIATNVGILLGVFIGIIFAIFVSNYTWQIRIYGTIELNEADIVQVLKDNGISTGKINLTSSEEIENILLNNYDRIAQVSVIKHGTAIIINLSEKLVYTETEYEPIIAKFNGLVTDVNIQADNGYYQHPDGVYDDHPNAGQSAYHDHLISGHDADDQCRYCSYAADHCADPGRGPDLYCKESPSSFYPGI